MQMFHSVDYEKGSNIIMKIALSLQSAWKSQKDSLGATDYTFRIMGGEKFN